MKTANRYGATNIASNPDRSRITHDRLPHRFRSHARRPSARQTITVDHRTAIRHRRASRTGKRSRVSNAPCMTVLSPGRYRRRALSDQDDKGDGERLDRLAHAALQGMGTMSRSLASTAISAMEEWYRRPSLPPDGVAARFALCGFRGGVVGTVPPSTELPRAGTCSGLSRAVRLTPKIEPR